MNRLQILQSVCSTAALQQPGSILHLETLQQPHTHTAAPSDWDTSLMKIHTIVWAVSQCQPNLNKCWKKSNVAKSAAMCPLDTRGGKGDHGAQHGQHEDWRLWTPLMVHKSSRPNISLNNQTLLQCSPDPQKLIQFCHKGLFLVLGSRCFMCVQSK